MIPLDLQKTAPTVIYCEGCRRMRVYRGTKLCGECLQAQSDGWPDDPEYDHVWFWRKRLPERKGQRCRVVARGKMNSILVEFPDGFRVVTARYAARRA